ncbi:MAG: hypothetical protein DMF98_28235 [Acidobacteria bacterium]|nr:MAG: hypothetical protein DMF98_28235 [Acidobacteriota bacterium]
MKGVWRYTDSTFSAAPLAATLIYPGNGAVNVDRSRLATWTTLPNADGYHLYVGSTLGARNLLDCNETQGTSCALGNLPVGATLFARLYTRLGGVWRYADSTFTATPIAAELVHPLDGATNVDVAQPFQWTTAIGAEAYKLSIGSTPGGADIADSGETASTSYLATGLPSSGILYARVWTKLNGTWARHSDIMFSPETRNDVSSIVTPVDATTHFNTLQPFQWSAVAIARAYRLTIGTAPGGSDLHDSGEIGVTRRFVPNLPLGVPLFGQVQAKIDGVWTASDFTFQVTGNTVSSVNQVKGALWATNFVREMASDDDGRPFGWSELVRSVAPRYNALDTDYAATLLHVLGEVNILTPARRLQVAFNATPSDVHTLVEVVEPNSLRWIVVDPTFDVAARRSDGTWASADDISAASLTSNWSAISYVFLGTAGDAYVHSHYLDYPLLYLNVYHEGQPFVPGVGNSPLPYLEPVSLPASGVPASYVIACSASASADVVIDGATVLVTCDGIDSLSAVFAASTVAAPGGSPDAFQLGRVTRFVF